MTSDTHAQGAVKRSVAPLVILLIIELLGLVPWGVFSALSAMGFDSGFHRLVVDGQRLIPGEMEMVETSCAAT